MDFMDDEPGVLGLQARSDLSQVVAAAADLCLPPWRHAVVASEPMGAESDDIQVRLEARSSDGVRAPDQDLELEIYQSGRDLHVMLCWCQSPDRPLLWHGRHPVWMDGLSGERCERPQDGSPLEALARRLRALLVG
jgi:hypothetical protein